MNSSYCTGGSVPQQGDRGIRCYTRAHSSTPAMHCRLLIPGLPLGNRDSLAVFARRRLPGLELLLARGRRTRVAIESREQWLLETFAVQKQQDWPSAPFALLGEGGAPGDAYWMHADPVYFSAGRDHV